MSMRRNRNGVKKERIIMLTSSVLVLAALTVTGVFVRSNRQADEGSNVVDFSAIESGVSDTAENIMNSEDMSALFADVGTDDLDYDPSFQEANSGNVENSDTDKKENKDNKKSGSDNTTASDTKENKNKQDKTSTKAENKKSDDNKNDNSEEGMFDESKETINEMPEDTEAIATTVQPMLDFSEDDGLVWPIVGDILLNYSMDKTIYFPTLQQYKYHPAIVISATEGEAITAAADGRVISVGYDPQLGNTVVMDLGNQYELTYGQLDNITVSEGSYVTTGDIIGNVAFPTKYYSLEGANVYFKLTKDGEPINPLQSLN